MDRHVNEWNLVIKVNYGGTLRRFAAYVHGRAMDHDMAKLKAKIINLFKFSPDAELLLTYTDEDGDIVTLDDDDELRDAAITQRLNPLRINVLLKSTVSVKSDAKVDLASSVSTRSPAIGVQLHQVSSAINEALKSIPEPLHSALSKISHDFVSKAASSTPAITEFLEYFSNLGLSGVSQSSQGPTAESSGAANAASTHPLDLNVSDEPKAASVPTPPAELPSTNSVNRIPEHGHEKHKSNNTSQSIRAAIPAYAGIDSDYSHASAYYPLNDLLSSIWTTTNVELGKGLEASEEGKAVVGTATLSAPTIGQSLDHNSQSYETCIPHAPQCSLIDVLGSDSSKQFPTAMGPDMSQVTINPRCSVPRHSEAPTSDVPLPRGFTPVHPYRRARGHHDSMLRTFHRGVRCDGCGMHPIMGPRFKSNVKEDYDLCSICFTEMGNEADYARIDRVPYRSPRLFKEFYNPHSRHRHSSVHGFHGCGMRTSKAKLESRFIQDITVLDGTIMSPCTSFTKIWRMRNNGTIAWPCGTQLMWIGGDQLGHHGFVELEIPANGCAVDKEIDIAVDFTSPSRPGRYISYWKMASPSGQKFGQRVWVLIQVDNSRPNSAGNFHADINLNLPPESIGSNGLGIIDVNVEPIDGVCTVTKTTEESIKPFGNAVSVRNVEPASVDVLVGANDGVTRPTPEVVPPISYPIIDFPETSSNASPLVFGPPAMPVAVPPLSYPIIDFPETSSNASPLAFGPPAGSATDDNHVEQTLLKELEEMGFKQIDLNKEILRLNEYDLQQSVDDLCGFAEWDPLLQELQEMGFNDKEMNKKLLIKNGGSIKRVVLDLIAGEKAE